MVSFSAKTEGEFYKPGRMFLSTKDEGDAFDWVNVFVFGIFSGIKDKINSLYNFK